MNAMSAKALPRCRSNQRGVAALVVAMLLLFGITLVAFFGNRSMIFEQRTSANQYRSTRAFEMAEAGLEWAVARLNENMTMTAAGSCTTTSTNTFANLYLPMVASTGFTVNNTLWPGCSIAANGATTCSCPTVGSTNPTFGASTDPRFRIVFESAGTDPWAVRVTSYGCTNAGDPCDSGSTSSPPDAVAVVSSVYKMKPAIANAPGAGLVTGAATIVNTGNINVVNLDVKSNGITIDAGTTVTLTASSNVTTLPGTPSRSSVLENDTALSTLTNADTTGDAFFRSFFGQTMAEYQNSSRTWTITAGSCGTNTRCTQCTAGANCGSAVSAAYNNGARQFWSDADVQWGASNMPSIGTLGASTAGDPIVFASSADIDLRANITAYGLFYAATATATDNWDAFGTGGAKVFGAFVSRGNFNKGSGGLDLIYDPNLFGEGGTRGTMVRVPGSWRDRTSDYTTAN